MEREGFMCVRGLVVVRMIRKGGSSYWGLKFKSFGLWLFVWNGFMVRFDC